MVVRFVDMDDAWEQDTISEFKGALDKAAVDLGLECRLGRLVVDRTNPSIDSVELRPATSSTAAGDVLLACRYLVVCPM